MSKSFIFLLLCLSFAFGIGFCSWIELPSLISYIIFLSGLVTIILGWRNLKIRLLGLMAIFLFLGILRFEINIPKNDEKQIQFYNGDELTFIGRVIEEPDVRIDHTKLTVGNSVAAFSATRRATDRDHLVEAEASTLKGKVLIKAGLYPEYQYGDELKITCDLKKPEQIEDFDYPSYLRGKNIYSLCYYPKIKLLASGKGNFIYQKILVFKNKLKSIIDSSLPEPEASLFSALALGSRGGMTDELNESFKRTGTTHIIAISGSHITLLSGILTSLIFLFISSRKKAFTLTYLVLFFYIILVGFQASAIRAGVMGSLGGLAPHFGRRKMPINALVFAASLMFLISPQILRFDLGFQLSFLAVLGIIYIMPILSHYFDNFCVNLRKYLPKSASTDNKSRKARIVREIKTELKGLKLILFMTIAAQIITLPWVIYKFKIFPLIGLLANLLILPIIPFLLSLGLLATMAGLFLEVLAQIMFWPTWLLLRYFIKAAEIISSFPWAALTIKSLPFWVVLLMYGGVWWGIKSLKSKV